MFPIALDLTRIPVLLTGQGHLLTRRLAYLDEAKAKRVAVFCENADDELKRMAGPRLVERLPAETFIKDYPVVLVAGLDRDMSERIARSARNLGKLVNVEDINDLCDFYFTANVRRGDLVIAVSTSGASPTLARKIRDAIAEKFGAEWGGYVSEMAGMRQRWKSEGVAFHKLIENTERYLAEKGWLSREDKKQEEDA